VKLGGVLDYKFELLRTIHTGIVAVAEWYNFRIPTQRRRFARRGRDNSQDPARQDRRALLQRGERHQELASE